MGWVDFGGVAHEVCLSFVPEVETNEYVVVHVGFAISRLDEAEAQRTMELLGKTGVLEEIVGERGGAYDEISG
jgi:hydrogenase expression/formation protein HypC